MYLSRRSRAVAVLAVAAALGLSACGSDDDTPASTGDPTTTTSEAEATTTTAADEPEGETVEVSGIDYAFEGLPVEVEAGTTFTFTNESKVEAHEMVLFKLPEGEDRPLQDLLALPEEEAQQITGPPLGVSVAVAPSSEGVVVEGELVAEEPGRYLALCGLPTGVDPKVLEEAMKNPSEGPPDYGPNAGPPHFTKGMIAEFTVS